MTVATQKLKPRANNRALKQFMRHRVAVISASILVILIFSAIFAPWLAPYDPYELAMTETGMLEFEAPPSRTFLLGTDAIGRDVLSRLIFGGRISLTLSLIHISEPTRPY